MNRPRRAAALILTLLCALFITLAGPAGRARQTTGANAQAPTRPPAHAAANTPETVYANVTVTDEQGRFITGLKPGDFTVLDGGQRREITSFVGETPATVGVLADASGSMYGPETGPQRMRDALLRFFGNCYAADDFFLIAFNRSPQLLLSDTNDPRALVAALDRYATARPKGQTALYDALYLALGQAERGKQRRKAILLISDGQDTVSRYSFAELRRRLKESDVTVYAVDIVDSHDNSDLGYGARAILEELADVSGGKAFFPGNQQQLYDVMERVSLELRSQYTIGFTPAPSARRDRWHDVSIRLGEQRDAQGRKIKTFLRARPGFYDVADARL
jgi:Ca-activated chloride channel homolog